MRVKHPFFYYIEVREIGFYCFIILPSSAPRQIYVSNCQKKKIWAKKDAAFQAVIDLKKSGYLGENLQPNFEKLGPQNLDDDEDRDDPQFYRLQSQVCFFQEKEIDSQTRVRIRIKCYPSRINEVFYLPAPDSEKGIEMNLYRIHFEDKSKILDHRSLEERREMAFLSVNLEVNEFEDHLRQRLDTKSENHFSVIFL